MQHRILVSNLGYARDIDGTLLPHISRGFRHFRTATRIQISSLDAYRAIVQSAQPDLCCMLEIDTGSFTSGWFNQFEYLSDPSYPYRDVCSKYSIDGALSRFILTKGKSNGFMAKRSYAFERLYLSQGSKRLIYRIVLEEGLALFFTHLSLKNNTRSQQLKELRMLADKEAGDVLIAGDFNILAGIDELNIFLGDKQYQLLNNPQQGTFTLFGKHYLLDICVASSRIAAYTKLQIIDQPFSDHDALFIVIEKTV